MLVEPRRLISSALAIVLGVAFMATALFLGDALNASLRASAAGIVGDATAVVTAKGQPLTPAVLQHIEMLPSVTSVRAVGTTSVEVSKDGVQTFYLAQNSPPLTPTTQLTEGRLPDAMAEVATTTATARGTGLSVGARLTPLNGSTLTVVGIVNVGPDALATSDLPTLFVSDAQLLAWTDGYGEAYLRSTASTAELARQIEALPGVGAGALRVASAEDVTRQRVSEVSGGSGALLTMVLAFAGIALFTTALVIANTFSILVAQRARQLAMLRCVGATRGQVFRTVLAEAAVVALLASAVGVAVGLALTLGAMRLSQSTAVELSAFQPSPTSFLVPLAVGVLVTLCAALIPARQATRIAPLAALRTTATAPGERPRRWQVVLGAVLVIVGTVALVASAVAPALRPTRDDSLPVGLLVGVGGGLLSFIGILLLSGVLVLGAARLLSPALRAAGVAGVLAADNAVRNPRRAAATASALLIGVTLITTMSVGAASAEASVIARIEGRFPVDAVAEGDLGTGTAAADAARKSPGVAQVSVVGVAELQLTAANRREDLTVFGLAPAEAGVARNRSFAARLATDTVVLPRSVGIPSGTTVTLRGPGGSVTLRSVLADRSGTPALLTPSVLQRLAPQHNTMLWARFAEDADAIAATTALGKAVAEVSPRVNVFGSAMERATLQRILDTVLGIVVGLLGVAVLIAVVGIGNTLSLSVLERTHESGLLRALGLSRRQLRSSVGLEAVLLAAVAVVIGIGVGTGYGVAGTYTIVPPGTVVIVDVPWARLAAVALVALAAGWLASVLPSIRAAQVSPAAALAQE